MYMQHMQWSTSTEISLISDLTYIYITIFFTLLILLNFSTTTIDGNVEHNFALITFP